MNSRSLDRTGGNNNHPSGVTAVTVATRRPPAARTLGGTNFDLDYRAASLRACYAQVVDIAYLTGARWADAARLRHRHLLDFYVY